MKISLIVLASNDAIYNKFKNIWIKRLNQKFHVYFVYGRENIDTDYSINLETTTIKSHNNYSDIFCPFPETFDNMFDKTIEALKIIPKCDYIIRTNLSTLFDYNKLDNFMSTTMDNFFGGPFIGETTMVSGTCMIMSWDITRYLVKNVNRIECFDSHEDVRINNIIKTIPYYSSINLPRLDFLDYCLYHNCMIGDDNIFIFRFKSDDRTKDVELMKKFNKHLKDGHSLISFCRENYPRKK